ncbi:methyl-accepting chemotaxis protein [Noviherbaspirillum pedocola]|uniref:Cache 3/Cache 2 fusion domain-containing protein n=1 Tax=Noviherbaspirillum pedocola TaxID=2801341 RepID=A0A934SV54_9BURK|nr:methyl-accepting chemotaxis protein [Noviherbaspirillum pedocola]MBK4736312.1 Cache 3/Cache 2 fusion domain-containing protein [Noviherbaspirillum pedocola]
MFNASMRFRAMSLGAKTTLCTFVAASLVFLGFVLAQTAAYSRMLEKSAVTTLTQETHSVVNMMDMFHRSAMSNVERFGKVFAASYPASFSLDTSRSVRVGEHTVPMLRSGPQDINLNYDIPDRYTSMTGVTATVFVRKGDEFIRVSTSVKKENGERAVGTVLDHGSPAYAKLLAGQTYRGIISLFGKPYIAEYAPVRDASNAVIGALYVGGDISADMNALKQKIKALRIGDTGFFYVLNAREGKDAGNYLVHPTEEGANALAASKGKAAEAAREMLAQKSGEMRYTSTGPDGRERDDIAVLDLYKEWNWLVVGAAHVDELTREAHQTRNLYLSLALVALAGLAAMLFFLIRAMVSRPLAAAQTAAERLAHGDLTVRLSSASDDEVGRLLKAMDGITAYLREVVSRIKTGSEQIGSASARIAGGNMELATRTEQQARALEMTASAMAQLTSTVSRNDENARQANGLAQSASSVATRGGEAVGKVVRTMESIADSSRRISEIVSIIDGFAFQTNILALNAAVEAARAGEAGRGFSVVAQEVRSLAQRSATAAREIGELIRASNAQIDAGRQLATEAGTTMQDMVESVDRVTGIMAGILTASAEQGKGIGQVSDAVMQMEGVTRQNAVLVEEAASASAKMREQADELVHAIAVFRLS